MSKHALEKHRFFPYVAWALCLGFAYFVYTLTIELKETASNLDADARSLEARANQNVLDITDFSR